METTRVEPCSLLEGRAIGELQGLGRWQFSSEGNGTVTLVRYDWKVETTKSLDEHHRAHRPAVFQLEPQLDYGLG